MFLKRLLAICVFISVAFCTYSACAAQYHVHKNTPHKSFSKKIDEKGASELSSVKKEMKKVRWLNKKLIAINVILSSFTECRGFIQKNAHRY